MDQKILMALRSSWEEPELVVRYDPGPLREAVRASVTIIALAIFLATIIFYGFSAMNIQAEPWQRVKETMSIVFPAVTSVLGTALGFYFGSQKR